MVELSQDEEEENALPEVLAKRYNRHVYRIKRLFKKPTLPTNVFRFSVITVFISFLLFYLVDLRNVFGLRDVLFSLKEDYFFFTYQPFFFQHWGRNSGFVEVIQWVFLSASALLLAFHAGLMHGKNRNLFSFSVLMSLAFMFMLLEDAGNIRHTIMGYVHAVFDEPDQGIAGTVFELMYFGALAALPLYAVVRYWNALKSVARVNLYILIGVISYFFASSLSFIGTAFEGLIEKNVYTIAGETLYRVSLFLGDDGLEARWQAWEALNQHLSIGFYLMDSLLEENIELIGAGAFLAAAILLVARQIDNKA